MASIKQSRQTVRCAGWWEKGAPNMDGNQAEIFIETLTDMLAEERAHRSARQSHDARRKTARFLRGSSAENSGGRDLTIEQPAV